MKREPLLALLAIDPGPEESAYVLMGYDGRVFQQSNDTPNEELMNLVRTLPYARLACEGVQSYGLAVGKSTFETCFMIGRIREASESRGKPFSMLMNPDVRCHLCGTRKAKDTNVRRVLLDRYPAYGGGKEKAIGTKRQPGPLYGCSGNHFYSALAVGWAHLEMKGLLQK